MIEKVLHFLLVRASYCLRRLTYQMRVQHLKKGVDWRFYEQYSIWEILKMKLDGTEKQKMEAWSRMR